MLPATQLAIVSSTFWNLSDTILAALAGTPGL
jgi:hypothetical protein